MQQPNSTEGMNIPLKKFKTISGKLRTLDKKLKGFPEELWETAIQYQKGEFKPDKIKNIYELKIKNIILPLKSEINHSYLN